MRKEGGFDGDVSDGVASEDGVRAHWPMCLQKNVTIHSSKRLVYALEYLEDEPVLGTTSSGMGKSCRWPSSMISPRRLRSARLWSGLIWELKSDVGDRLMVCLVDSGIGSEAMFATLLWGDGTPAYGYGGEEGRWEDRERDLTCLYTASGATTCEYDASSTIVVVEGSHMITKQRREYAWLALMQVGITRS